MNINLDPVTRAQLPGIGNLFTNINAGKPIKAAFNGPAVPDNGRNFIPFNANNPIVFDKAALMAKLAEAMTEVVLPMLLEDYTDPITGVIDIDGFLTEFEELCKELGDDTAAWVAFIVAANHMRMESDTSDLLDLLIKKQIPEKAVLSVHPITARPATVTAIHPQYEGMKLQLTDGTFTKDGILQTVLPYYMDPEALHAQAKKVMEVLDLDYGNVQFQVVDGQEPKIIDVDTRLNRDHAFPLGQIMKKCQQTRK